MFSAAPAVALNNKPQVLNSSWIEAKMIASTPNTLGAAERSCGGSADVASTGCERSEAGG